MDMLAHPQQPLLGSLDMARTGYQVVKRRRRRWR
jgi:diacylglycerol O-acyltransferase / wax synthase